MLGIAVLGAGLIGKIHASNVAANPNVKLVAIADPIPQVVEHLAASLNTEPMSDPFAAIERPDVDAVVIGTPSHTHADLLLRAIRLNKAVMCEKPVAIDMAQTLAVVAEVERLQGRVMMAFNRRFEITFAEMRKAIDAGEVGDVRQVIISSRDPDLPPPAYIETSGGIFRDMTIHDLDIARWLLGEEPVEVGAMGSRIVDPEIERFGDFDTVMVQMRTASGKQCHINNCRQAVYGYDQRIEVFGSKGMLLQDNLRRTTIRRWSSSKTDAREPLLNFFLERYQQAYKAELDAFVDVLLNGTELPTTVRDGLKALRLAECALESVNTGRTIRV